MPENLYSFDHRPVGKATVDALHEFCPRQPSVPGIKTRGSDVRKPNPVSLVKFPKHIDLAYAERAIAIKEDLDVER